jgi:protein-S-isoprenylcysteine O-methyltransferase Ste14
VPSADAEASGQAPAPRDDPTADRWASPYAVVPLVAATLGAGLGAVDPSRVALGPLRFLGVGPLVAGVALVGWTVLTFRRARATLSPVADATRLVTDGPLAYTRNPTYLDVVSAVAGVAVLVGSPAAGAYAALLGAVYHAVVVVVEEPRLAAAHGDRYETYRRRVPRWLPRPR